MADRGNGPRLSDRSARALNVIDRRVDTTVFPP